MLFAFLQGGGGSGGGGGVPDLVIALPVPPSVLSASLTVAGLVVLALVVAALSFWFLRRLQRRLQGSV